MRNVHAGHDPVVAADPGNTAALHGAAAKRAQLADGVVITDYQLGIFTRILLVLWLFTDGCELKNMVVFTDGCAAGQHGMRPDPGAGVYTDLGIYDCKSADLNVIR